MEFTTESNEEDNIWVASSDGNIDRVKSLLESGVSVHAQDECGYTPIHAAVSYGHMELIQFLLQAGVDVNCRDMDGDCPLHICEDPAIAEFLLSNGANEQLLNHAGMSVYEQALDLGNEEMVVFWAKRLGIDLTMSAQNELMESVEEGEEGTVEMEDAAAPAAPTYAPGTIITPGEPLPEPMNKSN